MSWVQKTYWVYFSYKAQTFFVYNIDQICQFCFFYGYTKLNELLF